MNKSDTLPQAILFDLDDTILAYDSVSKGVWRAVCHRFGQRLDGFDPDELFRAIQEYRMWYWGDPERHRRARLNLILARREVAAGAFDLLGIDDPELAVEIGEAHAIQRDEEVQPFPGALDTLRRLKDHGVRLALVTNGAGDVQRAKAERFDLARFFDAIVIEGEFGVGKPDERVYRHALDRIGSQPTEAWMVGDNLEWEVAAPQRLGMLGIWVDSRDEGLPEATTIRPDRIIKALPELLHLEIISKGRWRIPTHPSSGVFVLGGTSPRPLARGESPSGLPEHGF